MIVSHDHQLLQTIGNRVIEITPKGIIDRLSAFDEYLENPDVLKLKEQMYA